jgi:Pyruvate/2-oxoacid:ferredoxin oxidoreductase delta subunit
MKKMYQPQKNTGRKNSLTFKVFKCDKCEYQTKWLTFMKKRKKNHEQLNKEVLQPVNTEQTNIKCEECMLFGYGNSLDNPQENI